LIEEEEIDPNSLTCSNSALHYAAKYASVETADYLLSVGADINLVRFPFFIERGINEYYDQWISAAVFPETPSPRSATVYVDERIGNHSTSLGGGKREGERCQVVA